MNPAELVATEPPRLLRDLPVLIVDDNETNRRILEEWLRRWKLEPTGAGDGAAAMKALWRGVALGRPYALVLLDARMPDMDGLALAAIIRQRAELSDSRIVLLTSGDRPGDLARLRELRIDAHLLKPVQQDELLETIYRVVGRTGDQAFPARQAARPPLRCRCGSSSPRTMSSTRSTWSSSWACGATACGWRPTAGRRWT